MSVYPAPANQQGEIFNPSLWIVSAITGVSVQYLDENYLRYPVAQGYETLNGMTNLSNGTFEKNIVMTGTYLTNYIEFPDGSQQFTADSGGGSGDAQLSGGTSTTPQNFTGYNEFSNSGGQITLTNTTTPTSIILKSDSTNNKQLDIAGQVSIGNPTNAYKVIIESDTSNLNQLDINGTLSIGNTTDTNTVILTSNVGSVQGLDVLGGLFLLNSDASKIIQLSSDNTQNHQLDLNGQLSIGNTAQNGKTVVLKSDTTNNNQLDITGALSVGNTTNTNTVILSSDSSTNNQLNVAGDIFLDTAYKLTTNSIFFPQYPSSGATNQTTFTQNNSGLTINNELTFISYSTPENSITMYADAATNNQLNVLGILDASTIRGATVNINNVSTSVLLTCTGTTTPALNVGGNLLTTGNITLGSGSTSGASLTFGNGSVQTIAYTGQAPILATYTSSALDNLLTPFVWSFDGISNTLGNQVGWILYSNSAITTNSSSTVFSDTNATITPSDLNNYIYGSGTAIQIPYKFDDGTSTTNQKTYYPSVVVALGGFTVDAIGNTSGTTTFSVTLNSSSNTNFTNASTLKLVIYAG